MKKILLNLLVVEDDLLSRLSLKARLECYGWVNEASSKSEAIAALEVHRFDLAFVDLDLEHHLAGLEILSSLKALGIYIVILSGREEESVVEKAYQLGANDFLNKPFTQTGLERVLAKFEAHLNRDQSLQKLKLAFLTNDSSMEAELASVHQAMLSQRPILITGESGTGKTYLAKFIHQLSQPFSQGPFVHLNCAEFSESLIEAELFGHEKGAFTGAHKKKKGLLELAHEGILFLDEIACMPLAVQKKLLKAIEEKCFYPLGAEVVVHSNFRLISATCEDLSQKMTDGEFRSDLFFRIEGFNLHLKPLRERRSDLSLLIAHFMKLGERRIAFDSDAKELLMSYQWPGNVRELQRVIEVLQTKDFGIVSALDLQRLLQKSTKSAKTESSVLPNDEIADLGLKNYIEKMEVDIVNNVLKKNNNKVRKTLTDLKISNNSFYRILENAKKFERL